MYPGHQSLYKYSESRTVKGTYSKLTVSVLSWLSLLSTYYFAINKSKNETKQEQQKHLYFCTCFKTDPPCGDDGSTSIFAFTVNRKGPVLHTNLQLDLDD